MEGSTSLAMFTSAGAEGLQVSKMKGSLGFQTKCRLFKAFRASLRDHRGVCTKGRAQDRCHMALGAMAGDTELAPLTSSAPYNVQPLKDEANSQSSCTSKKAPEYSLG